MSKKFFSVILIVSFMFSFLHTASFAAVSYPGPAGTYTEEAAANFFGLGERIFPFETAADALSEVLASRTKYAVIPVENTIDGSTANIPLIIENFNLVVVGEINLPVRQTLIALPGTPLSDIKTIFSYPSDAAQSSAWLKNNLPQAKIIEVSSMSEAAKRISESGDKSAAAIASSRAASVYKLNILASDLQNSNNNITRFWIVTTQNNILEKGNKATLLVDGDIQNLHRLLTNIDRHVLKIVSIHAYPNKTNFGQYRFLIDVISKNIKDKDIAASLISLNQEHKKTFIIRIIGIYNQF